ncbi:MAG: response regulator [Acidobacteria bacterium]|nr:response regulator [Acidobacteriota bacterium]
MPVNLEESVYRELARRSHASGLLHMAVFFAIVASTSIPSLWAPPFYCAIALGSAFAAARFLIGRAFPAWQHGRHELWRSEYYASVLLMSATLGLFIGAAILHFGVYSWETQLLVTFCVGSGPISAAAFTPALELLYAVLFLGLLPPAAAMLWMGAGDSLTAGLVFLLYFVFLLFFSRHLNRQWIESVERENALEAARLEAERASKAKSEFLTNISHELRTPMNGIIGMTHLAMQIASKPEQLEYLQAVDSSSQHLLRLLNDLLDFSKTESGKLELEKHTFPLRETVEEAMRPFRLLAREKGLALSIEVDQAVPDNVRGDSGRVRQILINLISNAVKFTLQGSIQVRVACGPFTADRLCLEIAVSDTGPGIPPEKCRVIFEPFVQSDPSMTRRYGGTGLGLAICANLAHLMDGQIHVESTPGAGSTFRCSLWVDKGRDTLAGLERNVRPERLTAHPRRVLVVEDNALNQRLVQRLLERRGHSVSIAQSGAEALASLESQDFDVVLMDVQMPEMDGLEVTRHIRTSAKATTRCVRIIAFTAHAGGSSRQAFLDAGMDDFLPKPLDPERLYNAVESGLGE